MEIRLLRAGSVTTHTVRELPELLRSTRDPGGAGGVVWVDVPAWSDQVEHVLRDVFGFHPLAVADAYNRSHVPKVHVYPDHVFLVLHAPQSGALGHVHYLELDQFIGDHFLVTVHGPLNPAVPHEAAMVETRAVLGRLHSGKLTPQHGFELSHALASALTGRMRDFTAAMTREVWSLEQRVTGGHLGDPEQFLDTMFRTRHGLLTVRTMSALSGEVYGRMHAIDVFGTGKGRKSVKDVVDQFRHITVMADGQKEYLQGTIEFYQARTNTKMTVAAERLAVIAAVTLPITALSSVLGMNVIVSEGTHWVALGIILAVMLAMSWALLVWAKRKGWF